MLYAVINNQAIIVGGGGVGTIELRCGNIPLVSGQDYRLSFLCRSTIAQTITVQVYNSTLVTVSKNTYKIIPANIWKGFACDFTALATDANSVLRIFLTNSAVHSFYLDRVKLINLSKELKNYRVMRIQGSMLPGSFIQTLTLREVTASETA